jgi:hypothetical protein
MECDPTGGNNQELCTTDTAPASLPDLEAAMTATPNRTKSIVNFVIPNFPAFPPGSDPNNPTDPEEGQGLTIYVLVNQTQPVPVAYPTLTIF